MGAQASAGGSLLAASAHCARPAMTGDVWERFEPGAAGFEAPAPCAVLDGVARGEANIHGVVVERRGRLVAELYRRGKDRPIWSLFAREMSFGPAVLNDVRSVSKSVVGLLIGIVRRDRALGHRRARLGWSDPDRRRRQCDLAGVPPGVPRPDRVRVPGLRAAPRCRLDRHRDAVRAPRRGDRGRHLRLLYNVLARRRSRVA
jgi:hypothetical protein